MLAAAVSRLLAPISVYAQLEEVLVTAQKRSQNLQEVPIAISAINAEMIAETGVINITQIIPMVPGLTGSDYGVRPIPGQFAVSAAMTGPWVQSLQWGCCLMTLTWA